MITINKNDFITASETRAYITHYVLKGNPSNSSYAHYTKQDKRFIKTNYIS